SPACGPQGNRPDHTPHQSMGGSGAGLRRLPGLGPDSSRAAELVVAFPDEEANYFGLLTFSVERWAGYLARTGIPWPPRESGALARDDDPFREMARASPAEVAPIRELRHALGQLRLHELAVGSDGRNRCLLSVFASKTGRNQPSNSRFIF